MTRIADPAGALLLFAGIVDARGEVAAFAFLDPEWRLLHVRETAAGTTDSVAVSVRAVAAEALLLDAAGVVMAHNHPSGDPRPSAADLALTRRLARALDAIGVRLHDHLIVAGDEYVSFRELGLL